MWLKGPESSSDMLGHSSLSVRESQLIVDKIGKMDKTDLDQIGILSYRPKETTKEF